MLPATSQNLFISHASSDVDKYISPLANALSQKGITFWLDNIEITWGDSITLKINEGLGACRYVLLCLSGSFLRRPWPEAEMSAALAIQNDDGMKRVLPLILNSKAEVLNRYPLLAGLAYREFTVGPDVLASELANLLKGPVQSGDQLRVVIESVHTGQLCNLCISPRVSIKWLSERAQAGMGVRELADTGAFVPFRVRWVLVDVRAEDVWLNLSRYEQRHLRAIVNSNGKIKFSRWEEDRLQDIGAYDGIVFHLYAIEDEDHFPPPACARD